MNFGVKLGLIGYWGMEGLEVKKDKPFEVSACDGDDPGDVMMAAMEEFQGYLETGAILVKVERYEGGSPLCGGFLQVELDEDGGIEMTEVKEIEEK